MVKMLVRLHWITIELESKIDTVLFPLFTAPFVCRVVEDTWSFDYGDGVVLEGICGSSTTIKQDLVLKAESKNKRNRNVCIAMKYPRSKFKDL